MNMSDRRYSGYVLAVVACLMATVARLALSPLLGDRASFFTFVIAVLATASYSGFKPGLMATALGGVLATAVPRAN
jgi:hypothetical protein